MEYARDQLAGSVHDHRLVLKVPNKELALVVTHKLFPRRIKVILARGLTNWTRDKAPIEKVYILKR